LRLTQEIVDIIKVDESVLLGLASIKSYDEYTFEHSANVAVLTMFIADRIGMPKADISHVGLAALLHDIGKTHVPHAILNKATPFEENEWTVMKNHCFFGALELSRSRALRDVADCIFVALQHHVRCDGVGYPEKPGGWNLTPLSRIVTVADYFDAMTTPRVYKKEPMTPDKALRFILDNSGVIFDPFIAKTFIQVMGLYPVGTVVDLDTGERAVVVKQNPETHFMHRPVVAVIPDGRIVDLTKECERGVYKRNIKRAVYDPDAEIKKTVRFLAN
jgi:putative nucleotidyltransferase with HDIG domain